MTVRLCREVPFQSADVRGGIHHARASRVQRADERAACRLGASHLRRVGCPERRGPCRCTGREHLLERRELIGGKGNDPLSGSHVRHLQPGEPLVRARIPLDACPCLERARGVRKPGVDHLTVPATGMVADGALALADEDGRVATQPGEGNADMEPDDTTTSDDYHADQGIDSRGHTPARDRWHAGSSGTRGIPPSGSSATTARPIRTRS